jgi:aryl-alcohol dehydrogenase-like predicted oxidoreductase
MWMQEATKKYIELAQQHGLTPAQLALAFVRDQPFVTSTIIGATTIEQLKENLSAFTLERPLSSEIVSGIDEIFRRYRDPTFNK